VSEKITPEVRVAIKEIENILITKQYEFLDLQIPSRLPSERVKRVISEHGESVSPAPEEEFEHMYMVRIRGSNPPQWFFDLDLWIDGEKSDLTVSLLLISKEDGSIIATLNDLHVL
jgi:hypothetical protein